MKSILLSFAATSLLAALASAQHIPHYTVIDLDATDAFSLGYGINDAGRVGGTALLPGYTVQRAILWRRGHKINLGSLGGSDSNSGGGRPNGRDEVPIISEAGVPDPNGEDFCYFGTHQICLGAVWKHGDLIRFKNRRGGNNNQASLVNNRGQVIGFAENGIYDKSCASASPGQVLRFEAVIWGENGEIQQKLKPLGNDTVGIGFGINDRGQSVGTSGTCANTTLVPLVYGPHAVLWDSDGSPHDLGSLSPGSGFNVGIAINNRREVIGGSKDSSGALHTFLWTKATHMLDLGTVDTDLGSAPGTSGINNRGQVVGVSCINDPACNFFNPSFMGRAYLWEHGKMLDLNSLVVGGAPLYLVNAFGINDGGEITGLAVDNSGNPHAFLAKPVCDRSEAEELSPAAQSLSAPALSENVRKLLQRQSGMHKN